MRDPEEAEQFADVRFRMQHQPQTWKRSDQVDEIGWTYHDANCVGAYATCLTCEQVKDYWWKFGTLAGFEAEI